jgi:hypothetical protein
MVLLVALVALAPNNTSFNPKNIRKWICSLKETQVDMANARQNYSLSNRRNTKLFDIHMMCWGSGREITVKEYSSLLDQSG